MLQIGTKYPTRGGDCFIEISGFITTVLHGERAYGSMISADGAYIGGSHWDIETGRFYASSTAGESDFDIAITAPAEPVLS